MSGALYFPPADSDIQKFSTAYPGATIRPAKFLPHSTEGNRWEPYDGGKSAPHMTMKMNAAKPRTSESRQHFPATMSARALVNLDGGVDTNRLFDGPFQVEIVCTSGWASPENPTAPYTVPIKATDLPDWFLRDIGEVWAWLHMEHGTELVIAAEFKAWNAKRPTVTDEQWVAARGAIGHQHVPENDHTDPGDLDIERILWHAVNFVNEWKSKGYPYETELESVRILSSNGIQNAADLVKAAEITGVPLWIAAAFVQKESNGRNVYGNDTGGTFAGAGEVTEQNYAEFYRLVVDEKQKSNGVGPLQITYAGPLDDRGGYFLQAKNEGLKLWVPLDNFIFGLRIIARHLGGDYTIKSLQDAGTLYNKGNLKDGVNPYGYDLAVKAAVWAERLGVPSPVPAPEPEPTPTPEPAPEPTPTPPPPPPPPPPPAPVRKDTVGETLRAGDRGTAVAAMQTRLTAHGIPTTSDGSFGTITLNNVKTFQARKLLAVDGVVGKGTWNALLSKTYAEKEDQARAILASAGWRVDTSSRLLQAIKDFQGAFAFDAALAVDGRLGPLTMAALEKMQAQGGRLSVNFKASEFACKCGGKYPDCRRIWIARTMVIGAEKLRTLYGPWSPTTPGNSACRCPQQNKSVGGYEFSQHQYGYALDIPARFSVTKIKSLNHFQALGKNASNGTVRHVDNRASGPKNTPYATGSTVNPYIYNYG